MSAVPLIEEDAAGPEIRAVFDDIRKTRVWQEAHEEGVEEGIEKGIEKGKVLERKQLVQRLPVNGHSLKEIAQLLGLSLSEVRRLAR